jgi:hypothetical protein
MARETKLTKSTVQHVAEDFRLHPYRKKRFILFTDPFFVEKVEDMKRLWNSARDVHGGRHEAQ